MWVIGEVDREGELGFPADLVLGDTGGQSAQDQAVRRHVEDGEAVIIGGPAGAEDRAEGPRLQCPTWVTTPIWVGGGAAARVASRAHR